MSTEPQTSQRKLRRDVIVAGTCGAFVALMVGAAYASVPLYNWFCRTTGFAGTPLVASKAPDQILGRTVTVRFDSNVTPGLPWKFVPEQDTITVRLGEVVTVKYNVINQAARTITTRPVTFTCQRCGQEETRDQFPGPTPRYCTPCAPLAQAERNAARQRRHRERAT